MDAMALYRSEKRKAAARGADVTGWLVPSDGQGEQRPIEVDETSERLLQQDRAVRTALPYVEEVRMQLFSSARAPFNKKGALSWIRKECRKAAPTMSVKARTIFKQLSELRAQLEQVAGVMIGVDLKAVVLRWPDGTALGVRPDSPPGVLAQAARTIAKATGFTEPAVVQWVLAGDEPRLQRALISVVEGLGRLGPAATPYTRRSVVLTLNTPIREADFRRLFRQVRAAFDQGLEFNPTPGRRGPTITALDAHLQGIVDAMPDATWEDRAMRWREVPLEGQSLAEWRRGDGGVPADALRVRWSRLQRKVAPPANRRGRRKTHS